MGHNKSSIKKFIPAQDRYQEMEYRRCGDSGILLPIISLGLWHNFGEGDDYNIAKKIVRTAFDKGITHFDLANNYGPPYGSAEETLGKILKQDFQNYRDELLISTKAGFDMWPGPYGNFGSKKYLIASLDQSLKRLGLDYVDIFYHHRPDPDTPLEETMAALHQIIQQGKALYVGISNYPAELTRKACQIIEEMGSKLLIHQTKYNMMERTSESKLLNKIDIHGMGAIAFSPLNQGILTNNYLNGIPPASRAAKSTGYLQEKEITPMILNKVQQLNDIAIGRGQSLAQMSIAWILKDKRITSVLVGVSNPSQLKDNIKSIENLEFSSNELEEIEAVLNV